MTCESRPGPGRPRSIGKDGNGACLIVSQCRQLKTSRTCTTTLKLDGTYSRTSVRCSLILRSTVPPQLSQLDPAGCSTSSRGRCGGRGLRPTGLRCPELGLPGWIWLAPDLAAGSGWLV